MAVNRFRSTRAIHRTETAEDYVEMIQTLIEQDGEARAVELAHRMGVSQVTVSRTLNRLKRDGLVDWQPYRSVFLTDQGKTLAHQVQARHQLVLDFLLAIGVGPENAEIDAEGIEHHVSEETLSALQRTLEQLKKV